MIMTSPLRRRTVVDCIWLISFVVGLIETTVLLLMVVMIMMIVLLLLLVVVMVGF